MTNIDVEMCVIGTLDFRAFDITCSSKLKQGALYVNNDDGQELSGCKQAISKETGLSGITNTVLKL